MNALRPYMAAVRGSPGRTNGRRQRSPAVQAPQRVATRWIKFHFLRAGTVSRVPAVSSTLASPRPVILRAAGVTE